MNVLSYNDFWDLKKVTRASSATITMTTTITINTSNEMIPNAERNLSFDEILKICVFLLPLFVLAAITVFIVYCVFKYFSCNKKLFKKPIFKPKPKSLNMSTQYSCQFESIVSAQPSNLQQLVRDIQRIYISHTTHPY